MTFSIPSRCLGIVIYLASISLAVAQLDSFTQPVASQALTSSQTYQSMLNTFLSSQHGLAQQMEALIAQGATSGQIESWAQSNSVAIQNLQQQAINLAAAAPLEPLAYITDVDVPNDATPETSALLVTQADLFNRFAQMHNQRLQTRGFNAVTIDDTSLFQLQNSTEIQSQQEQSRVVAAQSALEPLPVPPALFIPANSSPQMIAYLTLRDRLFRAIVQLENQNLSVEPSIRDAALAQWQQRNSALVMEFQQMGQNLSTSASNQLEN